MILRPAQKIEVVESNQQCKAGSIGYFICQDPISKYNAWQMVSVFTRYGKKGKKRISVSEFSTHMINNDQLKGSDRKIIDTVQFVEGLSPIIKSDSRKSRRRFGLTNTQRISSSIIKPIDTEYKNLLDLNTWDFFGYFIALSIYLNRLHHNKLSYQLVSMPLLIGWNEFIEHKDVRLVSPDYIGYYIIQGLEYDVRNKDKSFEDLYLNIFNDRAKRKECLDKIIMTMLMVKDRDAYYKSYISQAYGGMEDRINEILSFYRKNKNDLKYVQKQEEEYKDSNDGCLKPVSPKQQKAIINGGKQAFEYNKQAYESKKKRMSDQFRGLTPYYSGRER